MFADGASPGPGAYNIPDGLSKIGATMKTRHELAGSYNTPGPGAYSVAGSKPGGPCYSMGMRYKASDSTYASSSMCSSLFCFHVVVASLTRVLCLCARAANPMFLPEKNATE